MNNILSSVKEHVGIPIDDSSFDLELLDDINASLSMVYQMINFDSDIIEVNDNSTWNDLNFGSAMSLIKTYIKKKCRILFDPPASSTILEAFESEIKEIEYRITMFITK